jgi:hypothetical protein
VPGDLVSAVGEFGSFLPAGMFLLLEPIHSEEVPSPVPLLLTNERAGAGYWAHSWGLLPYVITREPVSALHVYRFR